MRAPVWICLVLGGGILCSWERFGCVPVASIDKPSLRTLTDGALALPVPEVDDAFAAASPKPSPPPPPPVMKPVAPPRRIADFVRLHQSDPGPWQVTLYRLRAAKEGARVRADELFMGQRIVDRVELPRESAAELVGWMTQSASYADGCNGCVSTESLGLRLARGGEHMDLEENCGHIFLAEAELGSESLFSDRMTDRLKDVAERFL